MDLRQGKQDWQAIEHGGNLARAQQLFPDAPTPWIDLSTGINPHSYPYSPPPATAFSRLPEPADLAGLRAEAACAYGAPSADHLAAAPGTHILLPLIIEAVFGPSGASGKTAAILSPTYAEHTRLARLCGFAVRETAHFEDLSSADLAIVVNPNNPDGRLFARDDLVALSRRLSSKGGLLLVDEAFMEVIAPSHSVVHDVHDGLIVLRSFGKFYGLAGVRLGFAVAPEPVAEWLSARLGPWAIPGPTLHVSREAFRDHAWQEQMRERLARDAGRLDELLAGVGLHVGGGTALFRYLRDPRAQTVFEQLGRAGIFVRRFAEHSDVLRIGLPPVDGWERVEASLCAKKRQA
jgi:cobalamin biosynthetic protein CobC